jgi:hypothetical protein
VAPVEPGEAIESMRIVNPAGTAEPGKPFTQQRFVKYRG